MCLPPPRRALSCSIAAPPRGCAHSWPSAALRDATHRQYAVRWLAPHGAFRHARRCTEGSRTCACARCGHAHVRAVVLLGVPGNTGTVLEPLERSLDGTSDEVLLQALYKQIGSPLPNFQALRTLPLWATLATEAAKGEEGPLRFALWIRPPLGSALLCVVFLSGAHWELEQGELVRV
ncbi:hypothetical protein H4582DRAFT_100982 [Lactarius indigo]|nr:hypothetical protein H4582DRAFT_100982 [Lactarius indigo]